MSKIVILIVCVIISLMHVQAVNMDNMSINDYLQSIQEEKKDNFADMLRSIPTEPVLKVETPTYEVKTNFENGPIQSKSYFQNLLDVKNVEPVIMTKPAFVIPTPSVLPNSAHTSSQEETKKFSSFEEMIKSITKTDTETQKPEEQQEENIVIDVISLFEETPIVEEEVEVVEESQNTPPTLNTAIPTDKVGSKTFTSLPRTAEIGLVVGLVAVLAAVGVYIFKRDPIKGSWNDAPKSEHIADLGDFVTNEKAYDFNSVAEYEQIA